MTTCVPVNAYEVIGKPVADAVRAMPDMELAGVTDVATDWRIRTTTRHDIALYAATEQAQTGMLAAGLPVAGRCEDRLGRVDAVVDTTPKMVADADLRGVIALADAARDTAAAAVPPGTRGGPWWSCSPGTTWRPPGESATSSVSTP